MGSKSSKTSEEPPRREDASSSAVSVRDEVIGFVVDGIFLYGIYVTGKYLYKSLKPQLDEFRSTQGTRSKLHHRLIRSGRPVFSTTYYEEVIAGDIVDPNDIDVSFADIGGLIQQKRDIYDLVVLPLRCPQFFGARGKLLSVPKGILLYGEPGTGKTMLAKAIAKESGAFFINLKISTLMSKWFGESQKLVRAAFSLALKLAPCIIFIDEVDAFMGKRGGPTDPTYASMKTEFMALWDGFTELSSHEQGFGVVVLGATNRPGDVDPAFLRRMPRLFEIPLPNQAEREKILRIHLRNEVVQDNFDFRQLSEDTECYSGSDLKELCRAALMIPLKEHLSHLDAEDRSFEGLHDKEIRPICMDDFEQAKQMVQPNGTTAYAYEAEQRQAAEVNKPHIRVDAELLAGIMAAGLQQMMHVSQQNQNRS